MKKILQSNRGVVTVLAIGVMLFLSVILAGVLPMITQEVRSGAINRDVLEAQYAAEAGLKRAIAGLVAGDKNWDWVTEKRTVPYTSEAGKTYKVELMLDTPTSLTDGDPPSSGWYHLQSVGIVNNATKKVRVKVQLTKGGGGLTGALTNGVFGTAAINVNSSTINGSAGTNTAFSGYSSTINGNLTAVGSNNSRDIYQRVTVTGTTTDSTSTPPAQAVSVPTFATSFVMPAAPNTSGAASWPVGQSLWNASGVSVPAGIYQLNGQWNVGQSSVSIQPNATLYATNGMAFQNQSTIAMGSNGVLYSGARLTIESNGATVTMQPNTTIYVGNHFALGNSAILTMGDNAVLCVKGGMKLDNGSVFRTLGKSRIYIQGDLELANNGNALSLGGDTEIYISGQLKMSNPSQIITAANSNVVIKANSVSMSNSSSIVSGSGSSLAVLAATTISLSNTASIGNALVMAQGNISIQGGSITGSVISTGAAVNLYSATVTYDPTMINLVISNNPDLVTGGGVGGTGGASTVSTSEWKNF